MCYKQHGVRRDKKVQKRRDKSCCPWCYSVTFITNAYYTSPLVRNTHKYPLNFICVVKTAVKLSAVNDKFNCHLHQLSDHILLRRPLLIGRHSCRSSCATPDWLPLPAHKRLRRMAARVVSKRGGSRRRWRGSG